MLLYKQKMQRLHHALCSQWIIVKKSLETNAIGQFGQKMRLKGGKEGERNCDDYFCFIISGT